MKLTQKTIDKLESSIRKIIDNSEPLVYRPNDDDYKFIKVDPYILWNKYQERYTISLFYVFNKYRTLNGSNKARDHAYKLTKIIRSILPFAEKMDTDVYIKTKDEYKKYEDELIPAIRKLIPENKQPLHETKITQKIANILEKKVGKIISSHEPFIDDKFVKMIPHIIFSKLDNRTELWIIYIFKGNNISSGENWKVYCHFGELKRKLEMSLPYLMDIPIHDKVATERQYEGIMEVIPTLKSFLPEHKMRINEEKHSEEHFEKIERTISRLISKYNPDIGDDNFIGFKVLVGKEYGDDLRIKLTGVFKKPFKLESSDKVNDLMKKLSSFIKEAIPYLKDARITGGGTSTLDSYEKNLKWEKEWLGRKINESKLPFEQTIKNGIKTRIFNESIDDHELKWHQDENDRIVRIVKSNGWKFQMDNELPITLKEGDEITIPSKTYHRVIKGSGDLIIKIKEN